MVQQPRQAVLRAKIDWLGNGAFAGTYDDVTADVRADGLTARLGMDRARPLSPPMVGDGGYALDNRYPGRKYSPEFAGAAVYQVEKPGRQATIELGAGADLLYDADVDYDDPELPYNGIEMFPVLTGRLDIPEQHPSVQDQSVGVKLWSSLALIRAAREISTVLYQNIRTDQAVTAVLDAVGWSPTRRVIAIGDSTIAWWWLDRANALDALQAIANSEFGRFYETPDGYFHFENRNYRTTQARSTAPQVTIYDTKNSAVDYDDLTIDYDDPTLYYDAGGIYRVGDIGYVPGINEIVNSITHDVEIRAAAPAAAAVWTYGSTLSLIAGQVVTVFAVSGDDPWTGVIAPALTTDYTVTGTALASVTATPITATTVLITFTAGAGPATVAGPGGAATGPQLRAQPVSVAGKQRVVTTVDTTASVAAYGVQTPDSSFSLLPTISTASAQAVIDAFIQYAQTDRAMVTVTLINRDFDHLWQQLTRGVSDRVTVVDDALGLSGDIWIDQTDHAYGALGLDLRTTFIGSRTNDSPTPGLWDSGIWDVSLWGL
jgi:hypothetical protein